MPRTVTLTFDDNSTHVYNNVPDDIAPAAIEQRASADFQGKKLKGIDGGKQANGPVTANPNLIHQGDKAYRGLSPTGERFADIGGATVLGGAMGAAAPEILGAAANVAGAFPATAGLRGPLTFMSNAARAAGRPASAASGAIGGLTGETAGQAVELVGGGPTAAEIARFAAGGIGPEAANLAAWAVKNKGGIPFIVNKLREATGKEVKLSEAQTKYLDEQIAALRGGEKTDQSLEAVGSIMGDRGRNLLDTADHQMVAALQQGSQVGKPGAFSGKTNADIGERLRDVITTRNQSFLDARSKQYKDTQRIRDLNVTNRENSGLTVDKMPEYTDLVNSIRGELVGGMRSPTVQAGYQKILSEIENKNEVGTTSFQALDDVRRSLGEAFRGKPPQGYEAIEKGAAKDLYQKISNLQKKYAGPAQEKLLEDYHAATEGMQVFSSKAGKKATALDQFREGNFATDASTLPSTYFKTRASIQALKDLTGSNKEVAVAALEHADKELAGKTGPQIREWMTKNAEWLSEVRPVQGLVNKYATRLEESERSLSNAVAFGKQAASDAAILTKHPIPAQRAVDMIRSMDKPSGAEAFLKIAPIISQSPETKSQMVNAVRQVVADQSTAKGAIDLFSRNIRPFLEQSGIAQKTEMDFIAGQLDKIQKMQVPESEKLGWARRMLLQATGTWAASAATRANVGSYNYMANQVPQ